MHAVCTVNCTSRCHLHGTVRDGKLIRVEPGNMPGRPGYANACLRSMSYIKHVQDENARVMYPMKRTGERGSGEFERITWDEAIDIIAEKLNAVVAKDPKNASFYSFTGDLGKLSWEAPTRFAGCLGATTWDVEGIMGDHGASMGMTMVFGTHRGAHDSRGLPELQPGHLLGPQPGRHAHLRAARLRGSAQKRREGHRHRPAPVLDGGHGRRVDRHQPADRPALALGMMNWIIGHDLHAKDKLVEESVAPYLIREDNGKYLRMVDGKVAESTADDAADATSIGSTPASQGDAGSGAHTYVIWDELTGAAVDAPKAAAIKAGEVKPALSGTFTVDGVKCRTAFDHLVDGCKGYTPEYTGKICGIDPAVVERLAEEYITAKPAAIRMGQGMQRVNHSYSPFRTVARWPWSPATSA